MRFVARERRRWEGETVMAETWQLRGRREWEERGEGMEGIYCQSSLTPSVLPMTILAGSISVIAPSFSARLVVASE